jgi:hypothetical protein
LPAYPPRGLAIASKYRNAGQTCVCTNRILVQDGVYDAVEKVEAHIAAPSRRAPLEYGIVGINEGIILPARSALRRHQGKRHRPLV